MITEALIMWTGSAEQREAIRHFARGVPWGWPLDDPSWAADEVLSEVLVCLAENGLDPNDEALGVLRSELITSAQGRVN